MVNKIRLLLVGLAMSNVLNVAAQHRTEVQMETTHGNIRIALYEETPKHRDNFVRLVNEHFYDSLLFHRVIKHFMIQAGDPDSKKAESGITLGEGTLPYKIPAEIVPGLYHKRGAVAMAREADELNPEFKSDACQFYIVWGNTFSSNDVDHFSERLDSVSAGKFPMTEDMRTCYRKTGGAPHLDGAYTVFGEVVEGLDVVGKIQKEYTDDYDRPVSDVRILRMRIVEGK